MIALLRSASALALLGALAVPALAADEPTASTLTPGFAAGDATPSRLVMQDLLLDVANAGPRLVAVGEFGHIALSDDGGKVWRQAKTVPTQSTLTSVVFIDAQNGWAAGHDKTILVTADGGETWTVQYSREISTASGLTLEVRGCPEPDAAPVPPAPVEGAAPADPAAPPAVEDSFTSEDAECVEGDMTGAEVEPDIPFLGLVFTSPTHGIAVGGFNYAAETNDGGKTWTPRRLVATSADDFHLNAAFAGPDGAVYVPSELGQVYRSTDNGATWDIVETGYEGSFWGGLTLKDGSALVVGMRGNVWRSTDKGSTWTRLAPDVTPESLAGGVELADGTIVLVGIGGLVMVSKDGGANWDLSLSQADRKGIAAVAEGTDGTLLLFGESGMDAKPLKPQG